MPVLSFMVLVSSRAINMWMTLGIGVAGFLSGMALVNLGSGLLLVHPFVIMLKPAVAMSAQPDIIVAIAAAIETLLFLGAGLAEHIENHNHTVKLGQQDIHRRKRQPQQHIFPHNEIKNGISCT